MGQMAHAQLVDVAATWLRKVHDCKPVICEPHAREGQESPDVLGWSRNRKHTYLIECKVTPGDILNEFEKHHGCGNLRWLIIPIALSECSEIERWKEHYPAFGWGTLTLMEDGNIYEGNKPIHVSSDHDRELEIALHLLSKLEWEQVERQNGNSRPISGHRKPADIARSHQAIRELVEAHGEIGVLEAVEAVARVQNIPTRRANTLLRHSLERGEIEGITLDTAGQNEFLVKAG